MKPLYVSFIRQRSFLVALVGILACDSSDGDKIKRQDQETFFQTEFYTLSASSVVIDFKALIKKSFVSVSLTIAQNPTKGTLTKMEGSVYKYTPNYDFINGEDQFIVSAVLDDGATINSKPFTIHMKSEVTEFLCGPYAIEDDVRMDPPSTAVIHVLNNDRLCGADKQAKVLIHLAPKFGEAVVVGDSINYTPGPSFSQADEFVYSVSTSSGEQTAFGLVSFNKPRFEILEIPDGLTNIFFVDDLIGFIAGGQFIQKTIDGGRHWIRLTHPASGNNTISFEDIYFLDKDHGIAAFLEWPCEDPVFVPDGNMGMLEICPRKHMETIDAGVSWDILDLGYDVPIFNSPFQAVSNLPYTILSQGFSPDGNLGVTVSGTNSASWPARQILTISISTDRGKTWVELPQHPEGHPWSISVPSSNVAYILCWGKIIKYRP